MFITFSIACTNPEKQLNTDGIKYQIGVDIVDIPENSSYKSGYVLRYTLINQTGKDIYLLKPEMKIWKVGTNDQLVNYDYLGKYHHQSPDVEFNVLDSIDLIHQKTNQGLALQIIRKENANVNGYDLAVSGTFLFVKKGQNSYWVQPITGIQEDKGSYKIVLQQRSLTPDYQKRIPATFKNYHYIQPQVKTDTFNITVR